MFVVVFEGNVISGPKNWNKLQLEEVLREECEVEFTLPTRNDENISFKPNEKTSILFVVGLPEPSFDSLTQRLDGPYWNFLEDKAEMYYTVGDLPLEAIKNNLRNTVSDIRREKEASTIKVNVSNTEITVHTDRGLRDVYFQKLMLMKDADTKNFKFDEGFVETTKDDMTKIVLANESYVQDCFDWENSKLKEIEECDTVKKLKKIKIESENIKKKKPL